MERKELCPGSDAMEDRVSIPSLPSVYSIEGTRAHIVLEHALKNGARNAKEAHADSILFDMQFEPDFFRSIQMMLNYVYGILDQHPDAVLFTEHRVYPPSEVVPPEDVAGYCDVGIFIPSARTLYVPDFKHGAGIAKDIGRGSGTPQPWQYAAGFLYGEPTLVDPSAVDTVVLGIIQPRAFHPQGPIRELEVTAYEVFEYLEHRMDRAILRARSPDAKLIPGDTQCRFCPAKVECPARQGMALAALGPAIKAFEQVHTPNVPNPVDMTVEQIAYVSSMMPFLKSWIKDFEERRLEIMRQGYDIPGLKVVETWPRTKWYGEPAEIGPKLAALIGCPVEDVMEYTLIPTSQAKEMVVEKFKAMAARGKKKQAAEEATKALAFLTTKDSTGNLTVVPETDSRPAVAKGPAMFAQLGLLPAPPETT